MSDVRRTALHAAFQATGYVVRAHPLVGDRKHVLRVGAEHPALDAALTARGFATWAFLTAWNPHAHPRPPRTNARLQQRLLALIEAEGRVALSAVGVADDRRWFEESLFVPGLSRDEALRIGGLFDQEAVLWGAVSGVAELVMCSGSVRT
ncbi:DUF3293 domain-containing protein [Corallococcus sp. AB049A]|uniref:DUF3293 domain-containing protein n=1 Tax=Corallococcus interemptor TaxID=2316720 RepID=A0A3A8R3D2_9BACT|nr:MULTISPECIES: DUF3293 domain-containing protein [Corallococcus]RKH71702.1 DUF3293 domain-containing protein [Corallococcus interemptor]RKI73867.1 DUF3293 domain-containing protein [Corallococcus sp. AB049A]